MSKFLLIAVALVVFISGVIACGPEEEPLDPTIREALDGNYGEVFLSYVQSVSSEDEEEPSFQASARFVRVRDIERNDVRSIWGEDVPQSSLPRGECEQTSDELGSQNHLVLDGSLDLLDAGELTLWTEDEELAIPNWSFPSVYGVVAGVLYGGDDLAIRFNPGRAYRLASSGSAELGAFEVEIVAPEVFDDLTIGGVEIGVEPLLLEAEQPLEIRWEPGRATDEIMIEVSYMLFGGEQRIVCRSQDDGLEELPPTMIDSLWEPGVSDVRFTLYRITRATFEAEGLDDAEAIFVASVVVPATL